MSNNDLGSDYDRSNNDGSKNDESKSDESSPDKENVKPAATTATRRPHGFFKEDPPVEELIEQAKVDETLFDTKPGKIWEDNKEALKKKWPDKKEFSHLWSRWKSDEKKRREKIAKKAALKGRRRSKSHDGKKTRGRSSQLSTRRRSISLSPRPTEGRGGPIPATVGTTGLVEQLERLAALYKDDVLSKEEFETAKSKVLN